MSLVAALARRTAEPDPNACRHDGRPGHVESYFLRLNHPERPLALWVKATILAPLQGEAVAESWAVWFDGEKRTTLAHRATAPLRETAFEARDGGCTIRTPSLRLALGRVGTATGELRPASGSLAFDLAWKAEPGAAGEPLSIFPLRILREGPFPKSKLLTPVPSALFSGTIRTGDDSVEVRGWTGMQGHNWGREHAFEYAWGQCVFPAGDGPEAMVEGFSGRIRVAGRTTPRISALVLRRAGREYRFDRILDLWRQEASVGRGRWTLRMRGEAGEARLRIDGTDRPVACLGYRNPDGRMSYCFNTKLADVLLEVRPPDGQEFRCHSAYGGALEFLRHEADPDLPVV